jgi:hypothetical protein
MNSGFASKKTWLVQPFATISAICVTLLLGASPFGNKGEKPNPLLLLEQ